MADFRTLPTFLAGEAIPLVAVLFLLARAGGEIVFFDFIIHPGYIEMIED
jgi:hypothetical protein